MENPVIIPMKNKRNINYLPWGKGVIIDGKDYYPIIKETALALGAKDSSLLCKALKNKKLIKDIFVNTLISSRASESQ